jgi:hypothetical protein
MTTRTAPAGTRLCRIGTWIAASGALLIALAAGHRYGLVPDWRIALALLALGGGLMAIALVAAGIGLVRSRGSAGAASRPGTWIAFLAAAATTVAGVGSLDAIGKPPIHDITTDLVNPPMFVDAIPAREAALATNPPMYFSSRDAPVQAKAYPDLGTVVLAMPASEAFGKALATAKALGWKIISANPVAGRIEATATTTWIGLESDVVVRITPAGPESRVDLRSKSRSVPADMGTNAKLIRSFREHLTVPG